MALISSRSLDPSKEKQVPVYPSKERVERDGVLVYPEGYPIPEDDTEELKRQGYIKTAARKTTEKKAATRTANKAKPASKNK